MQIIQPVTKSKSHAHSVVLPHCLVVDVRISERDQNGETIMHIPGFRVP